MRCPPRSTGGTLEKFAGDAVMAAFGAPEALEDHAERALHAALAMQRKVESGLALRVGVNTGEVVAGTAREGSSFVSGDAVNVAARLEQAAEPGEVLTGERTVSAAGGAFEFGATTTIEAKGKPDGVRCRRVIRALSLMRTRGVGGLARTFVGRDAKLERLYEAFKRAAEGTQPVLVTVLGDAGVGKTRLMRELWEQLAAEEPEPLRRTGRCLAYGEGTFWPLAEVLKERLGILESDPPEIVRRRLGERRARSTDAASLRGPGCARRIERLEEADQPRDREPPAEADLRRRQLRGGEDPHARDTRLVDARCRLDDLGSLRACPRDRRCAQSDLSLEALLNLGRWLVALVLLGLAVNVLLRFASAEPRSERWVSAGSAFIVVSWAVMSVIFRICVTSVASFKSAWGTFVTILVLTAYLKISAIVFLVGAETDEFIRKDASPGETGLFQRMRAAFG
jgi:hypothetical protein